MGAGGGNHLAPGIDKKQASFIDKGDHIMTKKFYATGNGDFFQVVRETKTTVTVRPVKSESLGVTTVYTAFDYDVKRRAIADEFTTCWWFDDKQNANGRRCKKDPNGHIIINPYHRIYAYPSDGTEEFNRDLG